MKSKRILSLLMAALGSVSTSMAVKESVGRKPRKAYNSSAVKKRKKSFRKQSSSNLTIPSGKKNYGKVGVGRLTYKDSKSSKGKCSKDSLPKSVKDNKDNSSKKEVVLLSSSSQKKDDQSTWEKMSGVEKSLTIGVPGAVGVVGVVGTLAKRARDLKRAKKTSHFTSHVASSNRCVEKSQQLEPYQVNVYDGVENGGIILSTKWREVDFLLVRGTNNGELRLFFKDRKAGESSLPEGMSGLKEDAYGSFSQNNDGVTVDQAKDKIDKFVRKIAKEEVWFGREALAKTLKDQIPSAIGGSGANTNFFG